MTAGPDRSHGCDFGGACLLVIDDEEGVRRVVRRMLAQSGCRVLEAANGLEGLLALEEGAVVDLVLTDLAMPRVGGLAVVEVLGRRRPEIPVVLMSGDGAALRGAPQVPFLRKPFTSDELYRLVGELLSRAGRTHGTGQQLRAAAPEAPRPHGRTRYRPSPR
jgi:CheY-like chemotaxis protein